MESCPKTDRRRLDRHSKAVDRPPGQTKGGQRTAHCERNPTVSESAEPREFRGANDLRLRGDAWGSPDAPPVLLLHGGGQTRHAWANTARDLARAGWYAVSVDLRGHGESDWCDDGNYLHDHFARDTVALAHSFSAPPVLVGASLGGISALMATGENTGEPLARALILVDIATRMEADGAARIIQFMKSRPDGFANLEEVAEAIAEYNPHRPRPKDLSGLHKNLRQGEDGRFRWHWDPRFLEGPRNSSGFSIFDPNRLVLAAQNLTLPTLLVRGRMSDLLSQEGAQEFLEQVPHARFSDVSGAGHMVAGDRNDLFTSAVLDFLEQEVAGAA
jgi:pimeloyl-ACP methyl ester carboxylesterase